MKPYLDLLRSLLARAKLSTNRTNTLTIKVSGEMMKFPLTNEQLEPILPMSTTKKLHFKSIKGENLWFISGDTNNETLRKQGIRIWNEWALSEDHTRTVGLTEGQRINLLLVKLGLDIQDRSPENKKVMENQLTDEIAKQLPNAMREFDLTPHPDMVTVELDARVTGRATKLMLEAHEIPMERTHVVHPTGDLGPIYGQQWRRFPAGKFFRNMTFDELATYIDHMAPDQYAILEAETEDSNGNINLRMARDELTEMGIDQISLALYMLKTDPNSRRNIVTAWNPQVVPSGKISPQDNVLQNRAALGACHTFFQFLCEQLSAEERWDYCVKTLRPDLVDADLDGEAKEDILELNDVPQYRLNCVFYCRKENCGIAA